MAHAAALTVEQLQEALELVAKHGSVAAAARSIGMSRETFRSRVDRAKIAGLVFGEKIEEARKGWSPEHDMTHTVPDGFRVKGVSTLYDKDGGVSAQWVKSTTDHDRLRELLMIAAQELAEKIPAEPPVARGQAQTRADLLNCYVITDYHLGALAWGEETGAAWDLQIAEDLLVAWFGEAIAVSPASSRAVFAQLGDFLHFDGLHAVTPTSGNILDADTRFQKLVRVAIRVIRRVVSMLLAKHDHVTLLMAEGNHDIASSAWLRELFAALYEQEPRVTVETRPDPYYCVEFGATSVFSTTGT